MGGTRTSFGDLLRRLRSAAALSQEELAEHAGLSRHGVSDLERGRPIWVGRTARTEVDLDRLFSTWGSQKDGPGFGWP